jgi:hypothetical protein
LGKNAGYFLKFRLFANKCEFRQFIIANAAFLPNLQVNFKLFLPAHWLSFWVCRFIKTWRQSPLAGFPYWNARFQRAEPEAWNPALQ